MLHNVHNYVFATCVSVLCTDWHIVRFRTLKHIRYIIMMCFTNIKTPKK